MSDRGEFTPCQRRTHVDQPISAATTSCPDCGHTMLVHAGFINKGLDGCVLCKLTGERHPDPLRERDGGEG